MEKTTETYLIQLGGALSSPTTGDNPVGARHWTHQVPLAPEIEVEIILRLLNAKQCLHLAGTRNIVAIEVELEYDPLADHRWVAMQNLLNLAWLEAKVMGRMQKIQANPSIGLEETLLKTSRDRIESIQGAEERAISSAIRNCKALAECNLPITQD